MAPGPASTLRQRFGVNGQRVYQRDRWRPTRGFAPCNLHQRQARPVRSLPVELGVETVLGHGTQLFDEPRQFLGGRYDLRLPTLVPVMTA